MTPENQTRGISLADLKKTPSANAARCFFRSEHVRSENGGERLAKHAHDRK